jgi:hypothetical protein
LKRYTEITIGYPLDCKSHKEWIDTLNYRIQQLESFINTNEFEFNDWSYIPIKEMEKIESKKHQMDEYLVNSIAYNYCIQDFNKWFAKNVEKLWW